MNAEQFYTEFKNAINALGIPWGKMDLVEVQIIGDCVRYTFDNITVEIKNK